MPDYPVKNGAGANIVTGYDVDANPPIKRDYSGDYPVKDGLGRTLIASPPANTRTLPARPATGAQVVSRYPVKNGAGATILASAFGTGGGSGVLSISGTPPAGTVGQPYSFTPSVSGGSGTKSYALTGSLPSGLSFNTATGAITGTPATAGTTSGLSITVTDSSGSAVLGPFQLSVVEAFSTLMWANDNLAWGSVLAWG